MELAPSSRTIRTLLASDIPLIDVRAPAEFSQGAMPASHNLPLMNDEERAAVGTCYKQQGAEKALALGYQLVSGTRREQRTAAWLTACAAYPQGYLCCARGGQRSHIVQQWLRDAGTEYPLITGGYKALRQSVIQVTEELLDRPVLLIGGCTGSGKTTLVGELADGIDLEGLAHHRGSSFGRTLEAQFAQATFENHLTAAMIKKEEISARWVLEDEGRAIGANGLPEPLRAKMAQASLVVVEDPFERRLERLKDEYFDRMSRDFLAAYGEEKGREAYSEYLHHGLSAIRRRLGSQRAAELTALLGTALAEQWRSGNTEAHFSWLCPLLEEYYDPMYRYQLSKKADRILFRGTYDAVADWLK